ncbi:hypothetical protein HOC01_06415 [archaeon]|jgi:hypothetical protein|nr:hypothetical protein [archaeon]MBT6697526.1 hypothetical protein [archaeon]
MGIAETFTDALKEVIRVGSFEWLGIPSSGMLLMFLRFMLIILVFTIFFAVLTFKEFGPLAFLRANRAHAGIVAGVLAIISGVFMPVNVIAAIGGGWGVLVGLLLIGIPTVGMMYVIWQLPFAEDKEQKLTRGMYFIKFVLCMILVWVLSSMYHYITAIGLPLTG